MRVPCVFGGRWACGAARWAIANYEHDFNWVNIWQNAEEGEASSADFDASDAGKAVQASFDEVATCEPTIAQAWDGYFLRTGEGN